MDEADDREVFVVELGYDYEGAVIEGIWPTEELARAQQQTLLAANHGDSVIVTAFRVGRADRGREVAMVRTAFALHRAAERVRRVTGREGIP